MKYNVHLYVPARVQLEGIEANSQEQAVAKAREQFNARDFFGSEDSREGAVYDEGEFLGAMVDEEGDPEYVHTRYHAISVDAYLDNDGLALHRAAPDLRKLLEQIAGFTKDGEMVDGVEFILENDDAVNTLHNCINMAREAVAKAKVGA